MPPSSGLMVEAGYFSETSVFAYNPENQILKNLLLISLSLLTLSLYFILPNFLF
jgi:hypothetical protein